MQYVKLINVSDKNNNKYYTMYDNNNGTFTAEYGRIGVRPQKKIYPKSQWYDKYNEKLRKNYVDITDISIKQDKFNLSIDNVIVKELIDTLFYYNKHQISSNYLVNSNTVSDEQINKATEYLKKAKSSTSKIDIDTNLLNLYRVIPRKMTNVKDYLYLNNEQFEELYLNELNLLDNLKTNIQIDCDGNENILTTLGIIIEETTDEDITEINKLMNLSNACKINKKPYKCYKINKQKSNEEFESFIQQFKNKKTELVWHGSRSENWLSILKNGLLIRPSNAYYSGSAYGDGIYGSTCLSKSLNYTGNSNDKFLSIQEFHVGNQYVHKGWNYGTDFNLNFEELQKRDYDSTLVLPGNGLLNNEYVVYTTKQVRIKYLLWFN